jgi:sugar lactone lactonase YvrE
MTRRIGVITAALLIAAATLAGAGPIAAAGAPFPHTIVLPGAHSAEGIATGNGSTFYAGELFTGDIFRGDLRTGAAAKWIDAPDGRNALGVRVDEADGLLFVAGGFTGQGYAYDLATGATIATFQFGTPPGSIINDVIVAGGAAWFTDSVQAHLYRVQILGPGSVGGFTTLTLTGPAADTSGGFNLNGIAAVDHGATLIVAHTTDSALYTVNPTTGASARIAGADVPNVDGILVEAGRLWAVRNTDNRIEEYRLSADLTSASLIQVITDEAFEVPTTVARWGNRLAAVDAKFDTGFPPTATTFEVVEVTR